MLTSCKWKWLILLLSGTAAVVTQTETLNKWSKEMWPNPWGWVLRRLKIEPFDFWLMAASRHFHGHRHWCQAKKWSQNWNLSLTCQFSLLRQYSSSLVLHLALSPHYHILMKFLLSKNMPCYSDEPKHIHPRHVSSLPTCTHWKVSHYIGACFLKEMMSCGLNWFSRDFGSLPSSACTTWNK